MDNSDCEILDYLVNNKVGIDLCADGKLSIICPKDRRAEIQAFILQYRSEIVRLFKQDSKSLIVSLNDSDSAANPLFCVHAIAGTVYKYIPAARRLSGVCKVYGVQSCMFVDADWVNQSVPDMAARYVEQIRKIQPVGPYNLLGWSFGGVVAIEMACILNEMGEQVSFLGLVDTDIKTRYQPLNESELLENIHEHILCNFPGIDAGKLAESIRTLNRSTIRRSVGELIDHANLGSSIYDWLDKPPAFMFSRSFSVSFCQAYVDSILCLGDHGVSRISARPFCWWDKNKNLNERNVIKDVFGVHPVCVKIINESHSKILNSEEFIDSLKIAIESVLS